MNECGPKVFFRQRRILTHSEWRVIATLVSSDDRQ
jgi:hypothetical protein